MFEMPNNDDITVDLLIDHLIKETSQSKDCVWEKKIFQTYFEYKYVAKIKETIKIVFRIYRYKTHDSHSMNVYISKNNDTVFVPMFIVEGDTLLNLILCIESIKKYKVIYTDNVEINYL